MPSVSISTPTNGASLPTNFTASGGYSDATSSEPVALLLVYNGDQFTGSAGVANYAWGPEGVQGFDDSYIASGQTGTLYAYVPPQTPQQGAVVTGLTFHT